MLNKSKKYGRIIGREVKTLADIENKRGDKILKGELVKIKSSFRGYTIQNKRGIHIGRVSSFFLTDIKCTEKKT